MRFIDLPEVPTTLPVLGPLVQEKFDRIGIELYRTVGPYGPSPKRMLREYVERWVDEIYQRAQNS